MRFRGKVAMVTGGARGLGFAIANQLANEGASIAIADLDTEEGQASALRIAEEGNTAISVCCDVADDQSMENAVSETVDRLGGIDILVANAGLHLGGYTKQPCDLASKDWRRMLDVNVIGIVNGARSCRGAMRDRGGGSIITVASMAGYKGENAYGISKLAVRGLTVALAKELAGDQIRVCGVAPGLIGTEEVMRRFPEDRRERYVNEIQLVSRLGEAGDIANAVAFLASSEASFITGETLLVSGGALCRI